MMNPGNLVFIFMVCVTMVGALVTVVSGSVIYAMLGLVTTMFGIAGLYIYLNAPFLAMMQILIYVGAIAILIAFAIMLAGPFYKRPKEWTTSGKLVASLVVSLVSFFVFFKLVMRVSWGEGGGVFAVTTKEIGRALFDRYALPFELISLLIVVSIIGATMLALLSKGEK
ncbi:MAG: NADH-quinone oxidoreductase subunit J [Syntrophorhabdus sp. PtaU1.Bin002]|nr:MAG: NADH-quinone oxidoreductase subunit J [Syntrophorhabdus sp. PtaB.Bin006]OPY72444.1 MAG: NADH-quinone oxidoreductase subunit J [Syntrophorhabdus sp. PtaU1.Bin002]